MGRVIKQSLTALEHAQPDNAPSIEAARRTIAEWDRKLSRHRAALEAGADPAMVVAWSQQVQQQRMTAERKLADLTSRHGENRQMSQDDIHAMVNTLGGLLAVLRHANPADKAEVYRELGVHLTYNHVEHTVLAETRPTSSVCVVSVSEGGHRPGWAADVRKARRHVFHGIRPAPPMGPLPVGAVRQAMREGRLNFWRRDDVAQT